MSSTTTGESGTFNPVTSFPLRLVLPMIYPGKEFIFYMRVQMVKDAEEAQKNFVMLPDAEQEGDAFHKYDVEMLSLLSVQTPEGFPDFPKEKGNLRDQIKTYFYPDDVNRREGMRFLCRRVMSLYYRAIQPDQYL